ncbi:SDR family oxidoreductase [Mesorhizobium sp. CGMCC 1.15528]|uniref:SDR family oxidoreductase n=1 Tax=Mesorhizobium zhangyense TaxID=1776730 RepID=A0A7C9VBF8_9HYPH|nr:SDR family NAD(P)-dependent oxidoreductase [Mesorhizobium zhangyense]NGN44663.1 SDR family oxidoreductase [Mesorhizobium zhangyense]
MLLHHTPSLRLDGKRALVTGAGKGLGAACAMALADAGAHVVVAARTLSHVSEVADVIIEAGGSAEPAAVDVCDIDGARRLIGAMAPFDILVSNAGTNRPMPMRLVTEEDFDAVLDLNLKASYFVAQTVSIMMMQAAKPGSIIFMSSQMGHVGSAGRTVYCASKHAIEGLVKAMSVELGPHGIRVNSIAPTFIETPMTMPFFADENFRARVTGKIALGRLGTVEDVMGAIVFLASDAASLVTGGSLKVDGGWTAD